MRLLIVPRWSGTPASDWYPWLVRSVTPAGVFNDVTIGDMPHPSCPTIDSWPAKLAELLATAAPDGTMLVGHSVGCQAILRFLAQRPPLGQSRPATKFHGLLCVAGWWSVDRPWDSILPWIEDPYDVAQARAAVGRVEVLLSDNDPFTSDHEQTRRVWQERMGASVRVISSAKHFNAVEEPVVLERILALAQPLL